MELNWIGFLGGMLSFSGNWELVLMMLNLVVKEG